MAVESIVGSTPALVNSLRSSRTPSERRGQRDGWEGQGHAGSGEDTRGDGVWSAAGSITDGLGQ